MNSTVGAFCQGFPENLLGACRTCGNYDHFAAVLFLLAQGFFQRVSVGFVHFVRDVFTNPGAALIELKRRILLRDLLHADQNLQLSPRLTQQQSEANHTLNYVGVGAKLFSID